MLKDIQNIGKKNDAKDVSAGYARNFLFPRKLAVLANKKEIEKLEARKEKERIEAEKDLAKHQEVIVELEGLEVEIPSKTSETGHLYAAVSPAQISKALREKGFEIKKDWIKINEPIKEIGEKEILIEFPHGLEAKIKVIAAEEK